MIAGTTMGLKFCVMHMERELERWKEIERELRKCV
jgi:hypothetical protein